MCRLLQWCSVSLFVYAQGVFCVYLERYTVDSGVEKYDTS